MQGLPSLQGCITAASTISNLTNNTAFMKILNLQPHPVTLRKGLKMATILFPGQMATISPFKMPAEIDTKSEKEKVSEETLDSCLAEYKFDLNANLSKEQKYELLQILYQHREAFARSYKDIKVFRDYELEIQLKDPRCKSYTRQYTLSKTDTDEAEKQIQGMLEQGLIKKTTDCTFNSPLFLVAKKSNERRVVVDLRKINGLIKPITMSLPHIDTILRVIMATKPIFLTSCDLYRGYLQVKCSEKSSHILNFTSAKTGVVYNYFVLPMGLHISPAAFLTVMSKVFGAKDRFHFLWSYLDDIMIASGSFEEHVEHLRIVLETLRINNLVANPVKTALAYDELEFLGYNIGHNGISIAKSKIKAIEAITAPKTEKVSRN